MVPCVGLPLSAHPARRSGSDLQFFYPTCAPRASGCTEVPCAAVESNSRGPTQPVAACPFTDPRVDVAGANARRVSWPDGP